MTNRRPRAPIDMVNGRVLPQLLRFAVPMMLTGVLQLLYNEADLIVVGKLDVYKRQRFICGAGIEISARDADSPDWCICSPSIITTASASFAAQSASSM